MKIIRESLEQTIFFEKIETAVFSNVEDASAAAAKEIVDLIKYKQLKGEKAVLGLATGSTPLKVYEILVQMHKEERLSFYNVVTFNLDEYYSLPANSPNSYRSFMDTHLFDHVDIDKNNCFVPGSDLPLEVIKNHCQQYENQIDHFGGIDIQLLGIGVNGHIGFNEPGSHVNSVTRLITLDHVTRTDAAGTFGGLTDVPKRAITMGVGTILKAKRIVLLAWGERKAEIIKQAIEGPVTEFVPASYLQGHPNVTCMLDKAAANELIRCKTPWLIEEVKWDNGMIKKAVINLALKLKKPVLKLTNTDYNENGLSELLAMYKRAYDINIIVFNSLQHTITGWPGGKPGAEDIHRPERADPAKKRVLLFSPHPDDDIISMGGTFQRLVDQGHEVHVAYQTSGNIAVADDEALRFIEFAKDYEELFAGSSSETQRMYREASTFLDKKNAGDRDLDMIRKVKGIIRKGEAKNTCRFVGIPEEHVHFLNLPFYETGSIKKKPAGEVDVQIVAGIIDKIKPHQIYAAGDLADPHDTHRVCLEIIFRAVHQLKYETFMANCWIWLYKGAWAEWDIDRIEMAVPMSPEQVIKKRHGIFKHQSQKDGVVFQGGDNREFWQRVEERNHRTAVLYDQLGLPEYAAMEAFVRWHF